MVGDPGLDVGINMLDTMSKMRRDTAAHQNKQIAALAGVGNQTLIFLNIRSDKYSLSWLGLRYAESGTTIIKLFYQNKNK